MDQATAQATKRPKAICCAAAPEADDTPSHLNDSGNATKLTVIPVARSALRPLKSAMQTISKASDAPNVAGSMKDTNWAHTPPDKPANAEAAAQPKAREFSTGHPAPDRKAGDSKCAASSDANIVPETRIRAMSQSAVTKPKIAIEHIAR